jgi:hypothetical protein
MSLIQIKNELTMIYKKKEERKKINSKFEKFMAYLRQAHELNTIRKEDIYNEFDPNFPGIIPQGISKPLEDNLAISEEIKKFYISNLPELQEDENPILNEF